MNRTFPIESALIAALDAGDFVRRHGNSLSELLHMIAGDCGLDLYCEAERLLDGLSPDPVGVGRAVREMRDLLADADAPADRYAAALRWHGARLTDLASRLPA
ncbi:hypothetical protein JSE7799_01762 [Jannaschia seosinensis]|uniref:Uncharacterized protein n=1 Tax=Jannaschia seosinensis TaxID=313367 RepID=A0A0M7BAU5_9RHOB|nr:hypothetical protein [Jannaschia seosinensis]CUH39043.1 hypothetical protein JSE7799_01762 [Jannaschia seosinensis]